MTRAVFAGLCLLAINAPATAQQRQELSPRLREATRAAIVALADSLGAAGLPASAVYDKAAEGVLKGADDAQILGVVRGLAKRLRESRALLGVDAPHDALLAASSALYAGVPAAAIRRAVGAGRGRPNAPSVALTLTVLGTLVSQRVPVQVAAASIEMLLQRGARDVDLQEFQRRVERDIVGGGAPEDVTTLRAQSVLRTIDARRPPEG
ncbi:MAG: hypothetical protein AB1762_03250 [Gemmatimonadota bacterium]